jgi:zinc and cadmium transporter
MTLVSLTLASFDPLMLGLAVPGLIAIPAVNAPAIGTPGPPPWLLLIVYCGLIAISSLCGGGLPIIVKFTHTRMQILVSFIGGLMLGVGIFHQLPHAVAAMPIDPADDSQGLDWCLKWLMVGLLGMFFLLRLFHFHSHEPMEADAEPGHGHDHDHDHHRHDHDLDHAEHPIPTIKTSWIGILVGMSIHTCFDGIALAAHLEADALHGGLALLGFGTFLGVALHKPLDSLSITTVMANSGWSSKAMTCVNFGYALICPIVALLFYFGTQGTSDFRNLIVATALAISAGVFICISLSDLLPEVQFHSHDRLWLSFALIVGVLSAWAIGLVEGKHAHSHRNPAAVQNVEIPGQEHRH